MAKKPVVKLHDEQEMFEWETVHGVIRLPFLENLPMGLIEDSEGLSAQEFLSKAVRELMDEDSVAVRKKMTLQSFNKMLVAWNEQSAIKLGELFA
ncbi:hypothetical protein [Trueperella bialowiezensis]|uniref:Uncharacterized protein n=1 Tax=Trueperella bialowiezensis TaxID=312285 RepID=A0A3S4VAG3_9ACTO|nr:hypothetical protein [Trueperella bialowiezensis]VEI13213.1 Uncharacterised protein [Trueperella bialowiezensis]